MASSTITWKSKEEYKKQKELEEARKAGQVAPEKDEEGRDINPHIPQYISQAPWYLNNTRPSLKHQRSTLNTVEYDKGWYMRGVAKGPAATKYRKGACSNCGSMTHKAKECTDRPRKLGAKWSGKDIRPDEVIMELTLDYDGKRDRWNGYNPDEHKKTIEAFEKAEAERRRMKAEEVESQMAKEAASGSAVIGEKDAGSFDENEFKDDEGKTFQNTSDGKMKTTIRNLRIREDTAKYLHNLSLDSAYYDPKTRSMRENPNPERDIQEQNFVGDNFVRYTGDYKDFAQMERFAWEAAEKGQDVHSLAAPSQAALLHQQFKVKKENLKKTQKQAVLERYGGQEYLNSLPEELILAQTENYVEYARDGKVVRGQERAVPRTKYEEDVYINNHTSVWGSFWHDGKWGYACCHQFIKNSYCHKGAGKELQDPAAALKSKLEQEERIRILKEQEAAEERAKEEKSKKQKKKKGKRRSSDSESSSEDSKSSSSSSSSSSSESDSDAERKKRLKKAIKKEEQFQKKAAATHDDRKRPYNSLSGESYDVTEEEMEAYRLKRIRADDPMRDFLNKPDKDD